MKKIFLFICSILLMTLTGCDIALKKYDYMATDLGFDTVVSFIGYTENEATFNKYKETLQTEFKRYDKLFDKYTSYEGIHNIKTINDNAGVKPVKVDQDIIDFLLLNKAYDTITNHQFDVTMGAVLNIWHDAREEGLKANQKNEDGPIPDMEVLQNAKTHTGWEHIIIDEKKHTVYIKDEQVSLDVGGSAKGYAVEKIAQTLEKDGLKNAIINGGGNIRLIGNKPESDTWSVGVQIPNLLKQETSSLVSVKIDKSMSFVTSGDYQRYYMAGEQIMHHIIDPSTLMPARHCRSVTVITEDSGIADILSTTLYTLSHKEGVALIKTLEEKENIIINAIWVYDKNQTKEDATSSISSLEYELVVTDGIKDQISK